jgi:hypothetical protein
MSGHVDETPFSPGSKVELGLKGCTKPSFSTSDT